ncbi:NAD-dependent epimerase/dehydratase family protein [Prevotella communis]|uniref:NAD-dependent epimerase/dehydratase family protein n=1 Tax=Prevotella communis TaxID=2913614 RepID=UPI001EDB3BBD|nr:NAD-dependent epimerase/dehydratase family protein [Prevotella communis]UKK59568.1 NAD-dependent epimerase/dehydratase family protein [Prevotella communis]
MNTIIEQDLERITSSEIINWKRFDNKTVLISGANGMLPSYMVETLLFLNEKFGYNVKVIALVRNLDKAKKVFAEYDGNPMLEYLVQDVAMPIKYEGKVDFMVHAASQAAPSYYGVDPVGTFKANTLGTINMLELAKEKNVEGVLYFSTGSVYGDIPGEKVLLDEGMPGNVNILEVRNCYAESKRAGENACVCYNYQYKVPTKIIRIFHTFGPKVNLNDGRVFSDFCKNILNNENIVLKSDGSAKRSFLYVADAVIAYFKVLLDGEPAKAYNVGGDEEHEISIRDLSELLVGLYPEKNLKVIFDINENDLTYAKMRTPQKQVLPKLNRITSLGWQQTTKVKECFKRTIDALEA